MQITEHLAIEPKNGLFARFWLWLTDLVDNAIAHRSAAPETELQDW